MNPMGRVILTLLATLTTAPAFGQADLRGTAKQEMQAQVRRMARDLVGGVLDVQILQLEENGLTGLDLYRDIRDMRAHLDELIEAEMPEVIAILDRIEQSSAAEREMLLQAARQQSREILVRLLAERQNLLRRLRIAEMAAQVLRLIEMQSAVLETTRSLPERAASEREAMVVAAIENSRDIKVIYLGLRQMLHDVSTWGGPVAGEAAQGLRFLETGRVDAEMNAAAQSLGKADFDASAASQEAVIRGLRSLLDTIRRAQGLVEGDQNAMRSMLRSISQRQEEIRQATSQPNLAPAETERLIEEQSQIRSNLAEIAERLGESEAQQSLQRAEAAAAEAAARLFDDQPQDALSQQDQVLSELARAEQQMNETGDNAPAESIASKEWNERASDLAAAKRDVERIRNEQEEASRAAQDKPAEAAKREDQIAAELARVPSNRQLPSQVDAALAAAEQAARDAAGRMDQPQQQREEAARRAERAIKQAAAEIDAALADAQRQEIGTRIGELAQAAAALDHAAAQQRGIAGEAQEAAEGTGLEAGQAQKLGEKQAEVRENVGATARGLGEAAPKAAAKVEAAQPMMEGTRDQLAAASQQPGEPSKPAARQAAEHAGQAANLLNEAAREVRRAMQEQARRLAALSGEQLDVAKDARQAVEQAVDQQPGSIGERLERLSAAARKVRAASAEQHRAGGRTDAARAMELAAGIEEALRQQEQADRTASEMEASESRSPLDAISAQQAVADAARNLVEQAGGERPEATALRHARQAADDAVRGLLDSRASEAQVARTTARQSLERALEAAQAAVAEAAKSPPGEVDPSAQRRVSESASEAGDLAAPDAPAAAGTLAEAQQHSDEARRTANAGSVDTARQSQAETAKLLERAAREIADAEQRLAEQAALQLANQAVQSRQLAHRSMPVDPAAHAALQSAERQAHTAAGRVPQVPQQALPTEKATAEAMDRAVGELAAREQELARDKSLAEQLARLLGQLLDPTTAETTANHPPLSDSEQTMLQQLLAALLQQPAPPASALSAAAENADSPTPQSADAAQAMAADANRGAQAMPPDAANPPGTPVSATASGARQASAAGQGSGDTDAGGPPFADEPWFLELPPEVRNAMRANAQRRPPRGYEEKLQRYFRNID